MPKPSPDTLQRAAKALQAQSKAFAALAKAETSKQVEAGLAALSRAGTVDMAALQAELVEALRVEKEGRREALSSGLRMGCTNAGVDLAVVTREPLELRLAPLAVRVNLDADKAEILFAQQVVATCAANAEDILRARTKAVQTLDGPDWHAATFHAQLRQAWSRVSPDGGWAAIADVLPELVLLRQPRAFRQDPNARTFAPYPRAQLAWDLWRLRRDHTLAHAGWRLSVAPATGSSTKDKKLVFWLEDDRGQGQYHLTLRFVREEASRAD